MVFGTVFRHIVGRSGLFGVVRWPIALCVYACLAASSAHAQTFTWAPGGADGGAGSWDTTLTNWNGGTVAWPSSGTSNDASFGGTAGTVTVSGSLAVNDMSFNTAGYLITSGSLNRLTFNGATPTVSIGSGSATIQSPIGGTAGLTKSGAGTLVIDKIYRTGAAGNTLSGTMTVNGGTLVVRDTSGENTNIGYALENVSFVLIDNGTMSLQSTQNALTVGNKPVTIQNGGVLSANAGNGFGHALGAITLNGGNLTATNNGSFNMASGLTVGGSALSTVSAGLFLFNANRTFDVADAVAGAGTAGTDLLISSVITSGGLTKTGAGTLRLTGQNTYSLGTTVNAGTLMLDTTGGGNLSNILAGSSNLTINNALVSIVGNGQNAFTPSPSGTITINSGTLSGDQASNLSHNVNNVVMSGGVLTTSTAGTFQINGTITASGSEMSTISAQSLVFNSGIRTFDVADAVAGSGTAGTDLLVSSIMGNGGFTKTGAGTLRLTGQNTYSLGTTVNAGTLILDSTGKANPSAILPANSNLTINNALVSLVGDSQNNIFNWAGGTITINSGTLSVDQTSDLSHNLFNVALNGGVLTSSTAGAFVINGTVTATGSVMSTISGRLWFNGGARTFDVADVATGTDLLVSSVMFGSGSLTKTGAGRMVLTGQNTYTGTTQLNAGSLLVNGSVGGNVAVAAGATLGGSGVLGRTLSGAGLVSVGNSPGIGTAGAVDPSAGTDYVFEITGTAPTWNSGTSASVNDILRLTDATPFTTSLAAGNTVDVLFALSGVSPLVAGDYLGGFFIDNEAFDLSAALASGQFRYWVLGEFGSAGDRQVFNVGANGTGVTYSLLSAYDSALTASYTVTQQTVNFGSGNVTGAVTQFVVVPEPATLGAAAIGIALVGLARMRRRRARVTCQASCSMTLR